MTSFFSCFTGSHYVCVAWVSPGSYLFAKDSSDKVRAGIRQLASSLQMTVLHTHVSALRASTGETAYIGFASLMESHIALHTWPEDGVVQLDVYSCIEIPHAPILQWLKRVGATRARICDVSSAHTAQGNETLCVEKWER